MPTDTILTWRDFHEERPGTLGSIWYNREPTYADFLARMWETTHDGEWTPATLPAKPATLAPSLPMWIGAGGWSSVPAARRRLPSRGRTSFAPFAKIGTEWNSRCSSP